MSAIVTGAGRGIGAAIATRLAADGFAVAVNYAGREAEAAAVVQAITQAGGRAAAVQADVRDPAAVRALFDAAAQAFGEEPQVVVANAGVQSYAPIAEMTDAAFEAIMSVNVTGVFNTLREAAAKVKRGGRIISISSGTTRLSPPGLGAYTASKSAVETLTTILAQEMRGREVNVNTVSPGPVATDLFLKGKTPEYLDMAAKRSPLGRIGAPDDIAAVVSMLAGADGRWVNGQVVVANGGFL